MKNQLVNTTRISISNFTFELLETNQYLVKFYSTKTNKEYMNIINDIDLVLSCRSREANSKRFNHPQNTLQKWKQLNIIYSQHSSLL